MLNANEIILHTHYNNNKLQNPYKSCVKYYTYKNTIDCSLYCVTHSMTKIL